MRYSYLVLSTLLLSASAMASDDASRCSGTQSPDAKSVEQVKAHFQAQGWEIRRVKSDDGCFEIYGLDDKGVRREIYVDPTSLEIVSHDRD